MKIDLVIIGDVGYEVTIVNDFKEIGMGGSAYFAMLGAKASNNKNVVLVSTVGYDFDFKGLSDLGMIEINTLSSKKTANFVTVFLDTNGTRKLYADFGAADFPQFEIINKYIDSKIIFLSGSDPLKQLKWIEKIENTNYSGIIACDVFETYCKERTTETLSVIKKCKYVFMNELEAKYLKYKPEKDKITIIKKGRNGAKIYLPNEKVYSIRPQISGTVINTNGAGDILAGSFLSQVINGNQYLDALQFAVNLATSSVIAEEADRIRK